MFSEVLTRPHVLWFDEYYNEKFYKLISVLCIAKETGLLFILGTSGATHLPKQIIDTAFSRSSVVVDTSPNENLLTERLQQAKNAFWL